jgi:hypothetical protein
MLLDVKILALSRGQALILDKERYDGGFRKRISGQAAIFWPVSLFSQIAR